jgi:hypothetical protein
MGEFEMARRRLNTGRSFVNCHNGRETSLLDTFAAACAEAGRYEDAVRWQKRALELMSREPKSDSEEPHLDFNLPVPLPSAADPLRQKREGRLKLYQQGKPYRAAGE